MVNKKSLKRHKQAYEYLLAGMHQLSDDLHFDHVSQKKMNEIDDLEGSFGLCGSYYFKHKGLIFFIYVREDLDVDTFSNVFCDEFYHYCIDRIIFKWLDPQLTGKLPPLTVFVSEMMSHKACWDCEYLGSISCWKHPNSLLQRLFHESSEDKIPFGTLVERLETPTLEKLMQELNDCLFGKMYECICYEDSKSQRILAKLNLALAPLRKLFSRVVRKNQRSH